MKVAGAVLLILCSLMPAAVGAETGYGQVTFENRRKQALDLYINGEYGCATLAAKLGPSHCTTQAKAGKNIKLSARSGDEVVATHTITELDSGGTYTWSLD